MSTWKERRLWLKRSAAIVTSSAFASLLGLGSKRLQAAEFNSTLSQTPSCGQSPTAPQMQGPYFSPESPKRSQLLDQPEPGASPLFLTLTVVDSECRPSPESTVDLWCCNARGEYDNDGFHLRGHQVTDDEGLCSFELIVPGAYGSAWFKRTPHLHVKIQTNSGKRLTTQLYFPGHPLNPEDGLYDPTLELSQQGSQAQFVFVL